MGTDTAAATSALDGNSITSLRAQLRGELLEPSSPAYDTVHGIWNGMIDRHPALVARCRNAADVGACIAFSRQNQLPMSIRSGGHNVAGYAVCEGGLMIDLSLMNSVQLEPSLSSATVEGGATWADVDAVTTAFGRATPGGLIAATGVAGLTLGAGLGWLRGTHGLACDKLLAADVVTANGTLLRASETENPELFFCAPVYPEEDAAAIVAQWRDFMTKAPDRLSGLAEFSTVPHDDSIPREAWGRRVVALPHVYDALFPNGRDRCYWKSTDLKGLAGRFSRRGQHWLGTSGLECHAKALHRPHVPQLSRTGRRRQHGA